MEAVVWYGYFLELPIGTLRVKKDDKAFKF